MHGTVHSIIVASIEAETIPASDDKTIACNDDSVLINLNHKIVCQPHNTKIEKPKIGETMTMKGRCVSYDDLL